MPEPEVKKPPIIRFSVFELDVKAGELRRNGAKVKIQEQPLQILAALLERAGEIVTREELRGKLWPEDTFVDFEHGLNAAVRRLREALGDSAETPRLVETVARRGYRFIGIPGTPSATPSAQPSALRWLATTRRAVIVGFVVCALMVSFLVYRRSIRANMAHTTVSLRSPTLIGHVSDTGLTGPLKCSRNSVHATCEKWSRLASTEGAMDRREFMKQSVAVSMAAAGSQCFDTGKTFVDASAGGGRTITLAAKPRPIDLDLGKTVVMVVDMQNDFGSKGGMFDRAGLDISIIQRAVPPTARVLAAARSAGIKIVYLKMGFRADLSDMGTQDSPNWIDHHAIGVGTTVRAPNGAESRILVRDTWNTEILDELRPEPSDMVIYKHRYSGFFQTDLDDRLKRLGTRSIIFTGCTTSVCVESTLRHAMFHDYSPVLLADCSGEVVGYNLRRSNHEASLLLIEKRFGRVSTSEEFGKALQAVATPTSPG